MAHSISSSVHPSGMVWHPLASRTSASPGASGASWIGIVLFWRRIHDRPWYPPEARLNEPYDEP